MSLAVMLAACGGGGGGSSAEAGGAPAGNPPPAAMATAYPASVLLGSVAPVSLSLTTGANAASVVMISPVAAPLVTPGDNALASTYRPAAFPGAGIACVSAPGNTIGTLTGVNAGVNIKSAAVLLDGSWTVSAAPLQTWEALGASTAVFDGWENCGAKAEGAPSPSSTLTVAANGSFTDNVFDGNPSTTVNIVDRQLTTAQASAMLSAQGYLDSTQPANPTQVYLRILQNASGQTVLEEQGIPQSGATAGNPGFVAIYFRR
ncbi:hypothetical protein AAGS40_19570 [Paraburkholderia sp. PREW-6R]|uniref:hypothetical protein n=1 Tax=Paraburkholderia sp. PREW-6R TaxID=3141544 RepID=UPI0031F48313